MRTRVHEAEKALTELDGGREGTIAERIRALGEALYQANKSADTNIANRLDVERLRANASFGKGGRIEAPPLVTECDRKSAYPVQGALQNDRLDALEKRYETLLDAVNRRADEIDRIETILMQWEPLVPSSRVASNMLAEIRARHDADFPKAPKEALDERIYPPDSPVHDVHRRLDLLFEAVNRRADEIDRLEEIVLYLWNCSRGMLAPESEIDAIRDLVGAIVKRHDGFDHPRPKRK